MQQSLKPQARPSNALKISIISGAFLLWIGMNNVLVAADNSPHQHGAGELNIVVDGHELMMEVRLPAADVIGFEHSPRDDEQKEKVAQALASFQAAITWFMPSPPAQCALESTQASVVGISTTTVKPKAQLAPEHSHTDTGQSNDTHSDFEGTMQFHCDTPGKLDALTVLLFKSYPGVTELRVQMVTSSSQFSYRLTPQEAVLAINP